MVHGALPGVTASLCLPSNIRNGCHLNSVRTNPFMKACEVFILELTLRAWNAAEENKRRTLQRSDVAQAITRTDIFDFLVSGCLSITTRSVIGYLFLG